MLWAQSLRKTHPYLTLAPKDHRYSTPGGNNFLQKDIPTLPQKPQVMESPAPHSKLLASLTIIVLFKAELVIVQISAPGFLYVFAGRLKNCYPWFPASITFQCFPILFPTVCKLLLILTWRSITCTHLKVLHSSPWRDQELCSQGLQVQMWFRWDLRWFAGQNPGDNYHWLLKGQDLSRIVVLIENSQEWVFQPASWQIFSSGNYVLLSLNAFEVSLGELNLHVLSWTCKDMKLWGSIPDAAAPQGCTKDFSWPDFEALGC